MKMKTSIFKEVVKKIAEHYDINVVDIKIEESSKYNVDDFVLFFDSLKGICRVGLVLSVGDNLHLMLVDHLEGYVTTEINVSDVIRHATEEEVLRMSCLYPKDSLVLCWNTTMDDDIDIRSMRVLKGSDTSEICNYSNHFEIDQSILTNPNRTI